MLTILQKTGDNIQTSKMQQTLPEANHPETDKKNSSGESFLEKVEPSNIQPPNDMQGTIIVGLQYLLNNLKYQILITVLTLYSLFADDFRTVAFGLTADPIFDWINITVMIIFFLEIVLSSMVIENYFLSFYFFLDLISTVSIIFDTTLITNLIFSNTTNSSITLLASQSKASRVAARAVRIVKLFRIIRIIKIYKAAKKANEIKEQTKKKQLVKEKLMKKRKQKQNNSNQVGQLAEQTQNGMALQVEKDTKLTKKQTLQEETKGEDFQISQQVLAETMKKQSKIGKILSDMSIKKIIIVVLLLMFTVPLFNQDIYLDNENAWDETVNNINSLLMTDPTIVTTAMITATINNSINDFTNQVNFIIYFATPFNELPYYSTISIESLRNDDLITSTVALNISAIMTNRLDLTLNENLSSTAKASSSIYAVLDKKGSNQISSGFSLGKTLLIIIVLMVMMHFFSNDIDTLIVLPIEGMMNKLMNMAKDPQEASKEPLDTNLQLETTIISNAIIKIGALLSIVFGSAGAEIIGSNIIQEGDMNPMIEGKKKCAIFGFCDIRHFTEVTEVLQEEILIFVNKIGELVHESVYRYGGSANKNIGEAFLLVWKIPDQKYLLDHKTNAIEWTDRRYLSVMADLAVLGFVKTLVKINKDPLILEYRNHPKLKHKIPNFKVDMGFGLHIGWAIEGAIGSEYKIDASYLSPNVNMASRLEAATKQFGVQFLISQDLYDVLTYQMKTFCRNIDRVTVKGSQKPIKLYCLDLNYEKISPPMRKQLKYGNIADMPDSESKRAINMEYLKDQEIKHFNANNFIKSKKELREVLVDFLPKEFKVRFQLGVTCYLQGKWGDSRLHLSEAIKYKNNDGPTKTLLNYMKKSNYCAPNQWKQYRPLTSK